MKLNLELQNINRPYEFINNLLDFNLKILNKKKFLLNSYLNSFNIFSSNILINLHINYNFKLIRYNKEFIYFLYNKLLNKFSTNKININNIYKKLYNFKPTIILKNLIINYKILKKNFIITSFKYKNFINKIINTFFGHLKTNTSEQSTSINKKSKYISYIVINIKKNKFKLLNKINLTPYNKSIYLLKFLSKYNKNIKKNNSLYNFYTFAINLIFGQNKNIKQISDKLLNLTYNKSFRPIANWLFCGPSGTGKTELSKLIAKYIYKKNTNLIHLDMSEYRESHSISRLLGASPGYIGSDSSKNLVLDITNKPTSVVLFDEIEKANKDIYPIFLQILDEGILTDSKGNIGKFDKSITIFTSNLGSDIFKHIDINKTYTSNYEDQIKDSIKEHISPEFINRLDNIIIFKPLNTTNIYTFFNKLIEETYNTIIKRQFKNSIALISCSPVKGSRFLLSNYNLIKHNINLNENIILYNDLSIKCLTI